MPLLPLVVVVVDCPKPMLAGGAPKPKFDAPPRPG